MRIAFVVQRYGREVNGGAEYHCRLLAERLAARQEVETVTVFTSAAKDYSTWANHYAPGLEILDGVRVERFPSAHTRCTRLQNLLAFSLTRGLSLRPLERAWLASQGPVVPTLLRRLREVKEQYDAFIFFTYLYYPTVLGLDCVLGRRILVPTAHNDAAIHFDLFRKVFESPEALAFNTEEERDFAMTRFEIPAARTQLIGCGIDIPQDAGPPAVSARRRPFVLYLGRIHRDKGVPHLISHFSDFKEKHAATRFQSRTSSYLGSELELVIAGTGDLELVPIRSDIACEGFVSDERKQQLLASAEVLAMPSFYESLSLVTLEALTWKKPVLVEGACPVTAGHAARSRAGIVYRDADEFCRGLATLLGDREKRQAMGERGRAYVEERYAWRRVEDQFLALVRDVAAGAGA